MKTNTLAIFAVTSTLIIPGSLLFASEADDRIEASVKNSYVFRTFLKDNSVETKSRDGAVTLSGTVGYSYEKFLAQDTVEGLPAVKSVDNRIVVKDESPDHSDQWLNAKVKTSLLFHRNLNGRKTEVSSKDGVVTLQGAATSQAQKELTTEYAKDVEGVKDVKNEMTVAETAAGPDRTIAEKVDDASITAQIKASLLFHRSTSAMKTQIETRESAVTVSGIAENASEKSLVTKLITGIEGVTSVTNNMTVR